MYDLILGLFDDSSARVNFLVPPEYRADQIHKRSMIHTFLLLVQNQLLDLTNISCIVTRRQMYPYPTTIAIVRNIATEAARIVKGNVVQANKAPHPLIIAATKLEFK